MNKKSYRAEFAEDIARFIRANELDSPMGGEVTKYKNYYNIIFSVPAILDGIIKVYSENFVNIQTWGRWAFPRHGASVVIRNERNVLPFLKGAFVNPRMDRDELMKLIDNEND